MSDIDRVGYSDEGRDSLYEVWSRSGYSQAVMDASYPIEERLSHDPIGNGQPLAEGLWAIDEPPIRAIYEFVGPDAEVEIHRVSRQN